MIRNLIWDVDGTLFDTYPAIAAAFERALIDLGADAPPRDLILSLARQSLSHCTGTLAGEAGLSPETLEDRFGEQYQFADPRDQQPFPGAREVCEYIVARGGLNLIVSHRGRGSVERLLAVHGLAGCFSGIIGGDEGYARKPDPAAFVALIERYGLPRDETLAIGDREIDVLAGKSAGLPTCLFGEAESAADFTVRDFAELLRRLTAGGRA